MSATPTIPVIAHRTLSDAEPEYLGILKYESGLADHEARAVPWVHAEPRLNALDERKFGPPPAMEMAIADPAISRHIRGRARPRRRHLPGHCQAFEG